MPSCYSTTSPPSANLVVVRNPFPRQRYRERCQSEQNQMIDSSKSSGEGDTKGDGLADFTLVLTGVTSLTAGDLIL